MLNHEVAILRNFTAKPFTKFVMIHLSILLSKIEMPVLDSIGDDIMLYLPQHFILI